MNDAIMVLPSTINQVMLCIKFLETNDIPYLVEEAVNNPTPPPKVRLYKQKRKKPSKPFIGPNATVKILMKVNNFKPRRPDGLKAKALPLLQEHAGKTFKRHELTEMFQTTMELTRLQSSGIVSDLCATGLIKMEKTTV